MFEQKSLLYYPALLFILGFSVFFLWKAVEPYKLGIAPDSISYLSVSKHIAAGKGVRVYMANLSRTSDPIAAWPPFYPAVLALFLLAKIDFQTSTLLLNLGLLAVNISLCGFLVYRFTRNKLLALASAIVFALEPRGLSYHGWIVSEPLFLCLLYSAILFLWDYFENQKTKSLVWSAIFISIVPVTRYIGAGYTLGFLLSVFLFTEGGLKEKLKKSFIFSSISFLPIVIWSIRNYLLTRHQFGSVAKSAFGSLIHDGDVPLPLYKDFQSAYENITLWISDILALPKTNSWLATLILAGFFISVLALLFKIKKLKGRVSAEFKIPVSLLIGMTTYWTVLVIILRISRYGVAIPDRYVYPVYGQIILILFMALHLLNEYFLKTKKNAVKAALYTVGMLLLISWTFFQCHQNKLWADELRLKGIDGSKGLRWKFVNSIPWLPKEH